MSAKEYSRYMDKRAQMTPEGRKMHEESMRQVQAVKDMPKRVYRYAKKKVFQAGARLSKLGGSRVIEVNNE